MGLGFEAWVRVYALLGGYRVKVRVPALGFRLN